MRFFIQLILIALSSYLAESLFPWWTAAVCAFAVTALLPNSAFKSFLSGFLGVGLLWLFGALFYSIRTDYILTEKVAALMQLGGPGIIISLTAFTGALAGGMAALSGSQLRKLLKERRRKSRYYSA